MPPSSACTRARTMIATIEAQVSPMMPTSRTSLVLRRLVCGSCVAVICSDLRAGAFTDRTECSAPRHLRMTYPPTECSNTHALQLRRVTRNDAEPAWSTHRNGAPRRLGVGAAASAGGGALD